MPEFRFTPQRFTKLASLAEQLRITKQYLFPRLLHEMILFVVNRAAQTKFMPFYVCQVDASAFFIVDTGMLLARNVSGAPKHLLVLIWPSPIDSWSVRYSCSREQMHEICHSRSCKKYRKSPALEAMLQQVDRQLHAVFQAVLQQKALYKNQLVLWSVVNHKNLL